MTFVTFDQFRGFVQEMRAALSNIYAEMHQVNDRLSDVSIFEKKAEFAADMAGTATIGVGELRHIITQAHARAARSLKLWVAALGAVSVVGAAMVTSCTSRANSQLRLECAEAARQELDRRELRNEARDAAIASKAANEALELRDRQLELLIRQRTAP